MNHITNQSGERTPAIGGEESYARIRCKWNITTPKLIQRIRNTKAWSSIPDSSEYSDLESICEFDEVPKSEWRGLIATARFYYDMEKQGFDL